MCDYCESKKQMLARGVLSSVWGNTADCEEIQVVIDRGYLRLGYTDDMNCLDHGEKIKINFCPMCGCKINEENFWKNFE